MWLSDTSVKRPVFATVIALVLVAFGVLSFNQLPLREYPDINPPVVSVSTSYPGAAADVIETRITQLIEDQISGIEGVKTIRSSSRDERSNINIEFELGMNVDQAANDVRDRVARIVDNLPEDVDLPEVAKQDSDARPVMYISLSSQQMTPLELNDYAERFLLDRFSVLPCVSSARIGGGNFAMRIWLDRLAMAARGLTVEDVVAALRRENIELPAGMIESETREFRVRLERSYQSEEDFANLILGTGDDGHPIRMGEISDVELGKADKRDVFRINRNNSVGIAISKQSTANTLATLEGVKEEIARVRETLPSHMEFIPSSDDSLYIREAIDSVYQTLIATTILVSLVIFAFLGTLRTMLIPAITIPVCLTASFIVLAMFGFSVNLITLLALVLCIGLVVDDAIVVLENIYRRIEDGEPPLVAAYRGARQVGFAVIATTAVLVAVFSPIIFLQDNIGVIFRELAATISGAVIFSSILALSLTPVMCAKLLRGGKTKNAFAQQVDRNFTYVEGVYRNVLGWVLRHSWTMILVAAGMLGSAWWLSNEVPSEYAPAEDQGMIFARVIGAEGTSIDKMMEHLAELEAPVMQMIDDGVAARLMTRVPGFGSTGANNAVLFISMVPWSERDESTEQAARELSQMWEQVPGVRAFAFSRSGLSRGGGGQPVQFVIGGTDWDQLAEWRDIVLEQAEAYPGLTRVDADLKETQPQVVVRVDKDRAADMGVSVQRIGETLATMMSQRRVTTFLRDGEEYDVILQARDAQRSGLDDLSNIYVRSSRSGELVPLANLIYTEETAGAAQLNRYNRLRAVTISANLAPGYALGDVLEFLEGVVQSRLPETAQIDYQGESLEFKEASGSMFFMFGIALLIVFLVLAAQFESFVHPVVILLSVPLAIAGGLFGLYVYGATLNIYSQIGLVMLIGIAAKNGVLIVEFINQMRDAGHEFRDAIIEASVMRLRPVVMTTFSTLMGSIPLIIATGASSVSRSLLGVVIFSGVSVATLLTLFVVPAFYHLLARRTGSPESVARELEDLQEMQEGREMQEMQDKPSPEASA